MGESCPTCGQEKPRPDREPLSATEAQKVLDNPQIIINEALTKGPTKIPQYMLRDASEAVFQSTAQIVVAYVQKTKLANREQICELIRRTFLALVESV